jgi:hypothetical protein
MVKNRFLLVFALGAVSGCLGGLGTVLLANSWLVTGAIYVTFSFVPALLGSRWSSAALIEIWGLLALGTAIGVFGSVVLHPMYLHAHWVGYIMGFRSEHRVNLTFKVNYLRETCDSDPRLRSPWSSASTASGSGEWTSIAI